MNVESSMLRDAKELIVWASKIEARVDVEIHEDPPDSAQMEALDRLHPDLGTLSTTTIVAYTSIGNSPRSAGADCGS